MLYAAQAMAVDATAIGLPMTCGHAVLVLPQPDGLPDGAGHQERVGYEWHWVIALGDAEPTAGNHRASADPGQIRQAAVPMNTALVKLNRLRHVCRDPGRACRSIRLPPKNYSARPNDPPSGGWRSPEGGPNDR